MDVEQATPLAEGRCRVRWRVRIKEPGGVRVSLNQCSLAPGHEGNAHPAPNGQALHVATLRDLRIITFAGIMFVTTAVLDVAATLVMHYNGGLPALLLAAAAGYSFMLLGKMKRSRKLVMEQLAEPAAMAAEGPLPAVAPIVEPEGNQLRN